MRKHRNVPLCRHNLSRRRAIKIIGAAAGSAWLPGVAMGKTGPVWRHWDGEVMGAVSTIELLVDDAARGRKLVEKCVTEARRLESLFSLHDKNSAISRLNARGRLDQPDTDFHRLLQICDEIHVDSGGAFDISVQPLWRVYAGHFLGNESADPSGPDPKAIKAALALVDQKWIEAKVTGIQFKKPGMQITLNGIAQGYITDRIVTLLRQNGVERVMVDMGETAALGHDADNRPWKVGLMDPKRPFELSGLMEITDLAIATSGGYGFQFDKKGWFHHILDPKTGLSTTNNLAVSVTAPSAVLADGLSTAFSGMNEAEIAKAVAHHAKVGVLVTRIDGSFAKFGDVPKVITE